MRSEWLIWDGDQAIDAVTCASIIAAAMAIPAQTATVGGESKVNEAVRCSTVRWLTRGGQFDPLFTLLEERVRQANRKAFGLDLSYLPDLQFTTYEAGGEHYDWHVDCFWPLAAKGARQTMTDRKLSIVIQLSDPDEYEGGDFELRAGGLNAVAMRRRGTMLAFPSILEHRVKPVTAGARHSIVAWYEGPFWR